MRLSRSFWEKEASEKPLCLPAWDFSPVNARARECRFARLIQHLRWMTFSKPRSVMRQSQCWVIADFLRPSWIPWRCTKLGSRRSKAKLKPQLLLADQECMLTSPSNGGSFRSCWRLFRLGWTKCWQSSASSSWQDRALAETRERKLLSIWHPPDTPWNDCERRREYLYGRGCC